MAQLDLSAKKEQVVFGNDSVVIQKYISGIKGGRTLDMTDYSDKTVKSGHVIIVKDGNYKPMPVSGEAYSELPEGYGYAGILYRTISATIPAASIMTMGEVNIEAVPYPMDTILAEFKAACPHIDFVKDEEA